MAYHNHTSDDSRVIEQILDGEIELYRVLVDRYSPMIFGLTHRYAAHPEDAEDLAQDIFLKAYDSLDRFRMGTDFRAWLYTIGANLCRDYARNVRRSVFPMSGVEDGEYEHLVSEEQSQDRDLEQKDWASLLEWAIGQLPSNYASVFLMKYQDGLAYKEMAAMTSDSVGALKVRVHRARQELQRLIEEKQ